MNEFYGNYYNNPYHYGQQKVEIVRVNGEQGARAYNLPPNSNILMLDEHEPIVWLKTTDGAGYPTISGYRISEMEKEPTVNMSDLIKRIEALEAKANESNTAKDGKK